MNEALNELLTKLGFDRKAVWRISVIFWIAYIGSCVLAVYLSAWGMKSYIVFGLYLYMMLIALPLLFSPAFWLVAGGVFAIAGQFGREKGLSLKDAADAVKEYGKPVLNKAGYVLLVVLPIWFIAMILIDTKGIELWFLFGLPLLPTTIYLVVKEWPDGETFNAIVRTTLLGIVLSILALGVWNTLSRKMVDPAVQVAMEHDSQEEQAKKANDLAVANDIYGKLNRKVPLTPTEKTILAHLEKEKLEQSLKTKVERFVGEARPTEKSWWKTYWPLIGAIVIGLVIAWWMFGRTSSQTVVTTTGTTSVVSTTAKSSKKKWLWLIGIAALVVVVLTSGVGGIKNLSSLWKPAKWGVAEVITCPMGLATWEQSSGWCYTKTEQKPGRYRLRLRTEGDGAWQMRLAAGDYKKVPLTGMWLSDGWTNTPFEEEFLAEAPVKNNRVGSIIGRVGINGQPFDAFADGGEVTIEEPDRVGVSINLPNKKKYFEGNGGQIVLRLERQAD